MLKFSPTYMSVLAAELGQAGWPESPRPTMPSSEITILSQWEPWLDLTLATDILERHPHGSGAAAGERRNPRGRAPRLHDEGSIPGRLTPIGRDIGSIGAFARRRFVETSTLAPPPLQSASDLTMAAWTSQHVWGLDLRALSSSSMCRALLRLGCQVGSTRIITLCRFAVVKH